MLILGRELLIEGFTRAKDLLEDGVTETYDAIDAEGTDWIELSKPNNDDTIIVASIIKKNEKVATYITNKQNIEEVLSKAVKEIF